MARTVQDCLSRRLWKFKRRLEDNFINVSGTRCRCAVINVEFDKYQNTYQNVELSGFTNVVMDFPDDDIPTSSMDSNSSSQTQSNVLHMYDILPISAYFKSEDIVKYNIRKDSVILLKIRNFDDTFQILKLQITDSVSKGDVSSGVYHHNFVVAPITSYQLLNDDNFMSLVEELKDSDEW
jgi:hypothetical protein